MSTTGVPACNGGNNYYDTKKLKDRLQTLLQQDICSVSELERWLVEERLLSAEVEEIITSHLIDFYRDTKNINKRDLYLYCQTDIQPLLTKYNAELDKKFSNCPFSKLLGDDKYGYMRKVRLVKSKIFNKKNILLTVKEQKLITSYREIMAAITIDWDGETKPYPYIKAKLDSPHRGIRERAWRALSESHMLVKPAVDSIMNELVKLRHQMALNAGFSNYRDYVFTLKNREYSIQDCYTFHESVEKHVIPVWKHLAKFFKTELGIEKYRPWDLGPCTLPKSPFNNFIDLLDGVEKMLGKTDSYFQERFQYIRKHGLIDVEDRKNKAPGGACFTLPQTKNVFIYANFSPSFNAVNALIHEIGHAIHFYKQFANESGVQEQYLREEVAELYSHSLELMLMDKLDIFYPEDNECKKAQREQMHRAFSMLISPLAGDLFQHWLYTNPNHSPEERDAKYLEISKRFRYSSVDIAGFETQIGASWIESFHYFQSPFYKIEYAISELGALQLFQIYRENPEKAIALFKEGAGMDWNLPIADIYRNTGVNFDFSEQTIKNISEFIINIIEDLN
ncbi:M3 family oligoendopeptidase [Paenibacillus sp. MER TA 81-3]|uniref:M3 family oligoendopeptidase n=1 Tax=Paenibacillus sp. MER TA 81-3 TaxID=2939573 RepID=UPI00203ECA09|nr:M3 family oligoendopeptidase [Paenibacillus sp. MER TA 81-3]MCM3337477.1 M3 family oligoendopeptidase [Paenibacillus sp. MER TA 81-3]